MDQALVQELVVVQEQEQELVQQEQVRMQEQERPLTRQGSSPQSAATAQATRTPVVKPPS